MPVVPVVCFTDPVCPWSWASEPVLRRLQVGFGDQVAITYVQSGLARDVQDAGVLLAATLDAVAATGQAADPRVWLANPPRSSYPACQAAKAAAEQGLEGPYLRALREAVYLDGRTVDTAGALEEVGRSVAGLDPDRFARDLRSHAIAERFAADLDRARADGGTPELPAFEVAGARIGAEEVVEAVLDAGAQAAEPPDVRAALRRLGRTTTAEVAAVCDLPGPRAAAELWQLALEHRVQVERRVCGEVWRAGEAVPRRRG